MMLGGLDLTENKMRCQVLIRWIRDKNRLRKPGLDSLISKKYLYIKE